MSDPVIQLTGISKIFYTDEVETHALSEVSLSFEVGDYVAIAGPSGCGKSTLLSIVGLLDTPNAGEYLLNGRSVANLGLTERARIRNREVGFIFQAFNLIGDLTVFENVELPLVYRGTLSAERKRRTLEALERVGMSHRRKHFPSQLSGGQQQRGRGGPGRGRRTLDPARGRTDRESGFQERHGGHGHAGHPPSGGSDDLHGHPRSALRRPRRAEHPPVRRGASCRARSSSLWQNPRGVRRAMHPG